MFIKIQKLEKWDRTQYNYLITYLKDAKKGRIITVQTGWDLSSSILRMWSSLAIQAPFFMVSTEKGTSQQRSVSVSHRRWLA